MAQTIIITRYLTTVKVADLLLSFFLDLVSKEANQGRLIQMEHFSALGNKLISLYIFCLYNSELRKRIKASGDSTVKYTLSDWNNDNTKLVDESPTVVGVGGNIAQYLETPGINMIVFDLEYGDDNKLHHIIKIETNSRSKILKNNNIIHSTPPKLPMIVKPKPYELKDGRVTLGGYLNNDVFYTKGIFIDKIGYRDTTKINKENDIITLINGVSSTPYKINRDTFEFIQIYGIDKGIILYINDKKLKSFKDNPFIKMTKKSNKELRSLMSSSYLQTNILNIAETFLTAKNLYFPVRLDQTTRLYCTPDYFNYQSTDLAKGLICFAKPGVINKSDRDAVNYFKSYGALLFDGNNGKKSIYNRVKWVDNNSDYILNFENNDIINKAETKACFVSFCFEYKRYIDFLNNTDSNSFSTNLPIQLDASCNGYQHISLLTKQEQVFKPLNLKSSTKKDKPEDFYSYILFNVRDYVNDKL